MFQDNLFDGACEYATYEILVMLFGTLLLGCILGYMIWGWGRRRDAFIQEQSEKYKRISTLRQVQIADLSIKLTSLKEQLELADSRASLSEYRLRKAHEDLEELKSQSHPQTELKKPDEQVLSSNTTDMSETTLADISHAMQKGKRESEDFSQSTAVDISPESLQLAEKLFGRPVDANDFTVIFGIDQRMAVALHRNGIITWEQLSRSSLADFHHAIQSANLHHREYDPASWATQARMAMRGEWKKLKVYQESLNS
jgi:predicted flap endonuclease-1-like 5' DNA nuclease